MKPLESKEEIEEMRRKLYDRGEAIKTVKHKLSDIKVDVPSNWTGVTPKHEENKAPESLASEDIVAAEASQAPSDTFDQSNPEPKKTRRYRGIILIGSLLAFILVVAVTSAFLFFGGNQISNNNIQIAANGPQFIGGGEEYAFQVAVSNQNSVPIESATLIVKYPSGTRSLGENPRNIFEERIAIENLAPGEVNNVPLRVAVFGEESAEKTIEATIEYRINGSNGMFYKEADSLNFNISSSPLVLRVDNIEKVAAGQLVEVTLTARSNSSNPLTDLLVSASYPIGFNYQESNPEPAFGQNVWSIDEILPDEEKVIKITGIISGQTNEDLRINFSAGPSEPDNQFLVGATLAEGSADFLIERPFIDVVAEVNRDNDGEVVLAEGAEANVAINLVNTLDETVYDLLVEVIPGGNVLTEESIKSTNGFFDSNRGSVRWEVSNNESFEQVLPGSSRRLELGVVPSSRQSTGSFNLEVNVYARRVAEESAQETLIGTDLIEVKYSSIISLGSQATVVSGPVPPQVGESTEYELTIVAEAGLNDLTGGIVRTSFPLHAEWLDDYTAPGEVTYNSISKELEWDPGDFEAGQRKVLVLKVRLQPSSSQAETIPVLMNTQTFRGNDRFTGALLQDSTQAVTTELSTEMGFEPKNGVVVR